MRRSGVVAFVLVFILGFSVVSAGTCVPGDNNHIFSLYQNTNSHASLWNGTGTVTVCYNDTFGSENLIVNPHECTPSNRVISLFNSSNSHAAEDHDSVDYNEAVCFGDLECTPRASCSAGEFGVARLFSSTNSHVSDMTDTAYPIILCCHSPTAGAGPGSDIWQNTLGDPITDAEVGDTVIMFDGNHNVSYPHGTEVIFEVFENTGVTQDVRTRSEGNAIIGYYDSGLLAAVGNWTITQDDLNVDSGSFDEFEFRTSGDDYADPSDSSLAVSEISDDDPPRVSIISPSCGLSFFQGISRDIELVADDDDDLLTGTVTIIDGITDGTPDYTFENGPSTFSYDFPNAINTRIVVEATSRSGQIANSTSVMVVDQGESGEYLAACITEPAGLELISTSRVEFDASSTTGINYHANNLTNYSIEKDRMTFNWEFLDVDTGEIVVNPHSDGGNSQAWDFEVTFAEVGRKIATLEVVLT